MSRTLRWGAAGLVRAVVFGVVTWVTGAFLLPLVMKSAGDRWAVASGLGVAVAALAALWGHSWAGPRRVFAGGHRGPGAGSGAAGPADRSVTAGGDVSGIASTGDGTTNTQLR